jgi:alpha-glucosidase (family GH31 glycosyl hydrolase)
MTTQVQLDLIAAGGIQDIFIIIGDDPNEVVQSYHKNIVGTPVTIPQWVLGWNQCRYGYKTLDEVKEVVANYSKYDIPLDTQWTDIDYLNNYRDFTYDDVSYKGLPEFIDELHDKHMHYIPILDLGISHRPGLDYEAFNEGFDQDVYLKIGDGALKENFIGRVWPNDAVYPDFRATNTEAWWKNYLSSLHDSIHFDGLWTDMNEASNFCNGACYPFDQSVDSPVKYKLPYIPTGRDLEFKSISLDAVDAEGYKQVDRHSMMGTLEVRATHNWFVENDMRSMIISRSSFAGLGKYGSRWLGDNFADVSMLDYSVKGIMQQNMFGIPLVGADICGFIGDTTPELCARWTTVGAFYPFSRNHNNFGQEF